MTAHDFMNIYINWLIVETYMSL